MPTFLDHLRPHLDAGGRLNDFLEIRGGRVIFASALDLLDLVERHGAPLEVAFCPLIARRIREMQAHFAAARARAGYHGELVYAYATKANFAEEVVRTAVMSGAHYETSSAFDVRVAHRLWQSGVLPADRFVFCNGSKERPYLDAILDLRQAGCANVVPILDDPQEFEALASYPRPLLLGVRERKDPGDLAEGTTYGYDRFGMLPDELAALAARVAATPHRIVLYHAMVGSQLADRAFWTREAIESLDGYARLRALAPALDHFDFGGGMPTGAYSLDFRFDYAEFAEQLQRAVGGWCDARGLPHPQLVGEFGRYSVADHGLHIFRVGRVKRGHPTRPPWYLLDGSLMVALPDILIVEGQRFITLPLNHLDAPAGPVVLGGRRTCDSDDFYPRGDLELMMPLVSRGQGSGVRGQEDATDPRSLIPAPLLVAFFGTGAYQAMLAGEGGAHHCLAPEAPKVIVEEQGGSLVTRVIGEQTWEDVLGELGYR
ncbi:MAG TPA: arginine decarboxylase [Roseiflexaceae bacterium]